jgi:hypothetical protein
MAGPKYKEQEMPCKHKAILKKYSSAHDLPQVSAKAGKPSP